MKTETGVLIALGGAALYFAWRGQQAANGEKSTGILPGISLPAIQAPGADAIPEFQSFNMPEFSFTMPELEFTMPEGKTPTALGDVGQQITDALTGFLGGLKAGEGDGGILPDLPGLPDLPKIPGLTGGDGGIGFPDYMAEIWENIQRQGSAIAGTATNIAESGAHVSGGVATGLEFMEGTWGGIATGLGFVEDSLNPGKVGSLVKRIIGIGDGKSEHEPLTAERKAQIISEAENFWSEEQVEKETRRLLTALGVPPE